MINSSLEFAEKVTEASRHFCARILINGTEIPDYVQKVSVHLGSCGGATFMVGAVFVPHVEVTLDGRETDLEGQEMELQLGLILEDGVREYLTMGYFTAETPAVTAYQTTFVAQGRIASRFSGSFTPPEDQTITAIIAALQTQSGVGIVLRGLTDTGRIEKPLTGLSCRQVLGVVAGVLGGYATETNDGRVVIAKYSTDVVRSFNGDSMTALPASDNCNFQINGVRVTVSESTTDNDGNVTPPVVYETGELPVDIDNEYMTAELFEAYAENLVGLTYRPGTIQLALGDPRLEASDAVEIQDITGDIYVIPCMSVTHHFDGGLWTEIKAPGPISTTEILGATGQAVKNLQLAMLQVQRLFAKYARIDLLNVDEIRDDAGNNWWNLRTGEMKVSTKISADQIRGGTFLVGGDEGQYSQIIAYGTDGKPHGFYRSDGLFFAEDATIGGALTWISQRGISVGDGVIHPIIAGETRAFFGVDERNKGQIYLIDTSASSPTNGFEARGDGTVKCKALYLNENQLSDYVVENGTDSIWTYRKWASGKVECWGYDTITEALQNVSGGMYYGAAHYASFPAGLFTSSHNGKSGLQSCQISVDGNALLWYGSGSTYKRTQTYYLANPAKITTQVTFYVYYHAIGWWK